MFYDRLLGTVHFIMITIKKADLTKKREYSKEMKLDGFISSVELSGMHFTQIDALGIDSRKLDNSKILKQKFESDNNLRCICLDYGGRTKKYWYKVDDLRKLYFISS